MSANDEQNPVERSDAELVAAAKSGQLQAFGELVERSQGLARAVAYSASGDMASVEDLVQEALVTAWTRLSDLTDPSAFRPWLVGIVRNTVRYWRRHQRRHAPRAQAGMDTLTRLASTAPSPLEEAQVQQDWKHTTMALQALPAKYREPLVLYYSLGESHAQVAEALGLSEASARQRVHRARKRLSTQVTNVERGGQRLAAGASVAAGVLLVIQSRDALALAPVSTVATVSPKVFLAVGAFGGTAIIAGIVGFVMLISGESTGSSLSASPDVSSSMKTSSPVRQTVPQIGEVAEVSRSSIPRSSIPRSSIPRSSNGFVSMGQGKVGDQSDSVAEPLPSPAPTFDSDKATNPSDSRPSRGRKSGRIKKHGPAVLHEDKPKRLLVPDIDMQAVKREFWQ